MDAKTEFIKKKISNTGMSVRKFAESIGIPNTTLNSMLSRGIGNASVNNVIKICSALNICVESLYDICKHNDIPLTNEEKELLKNFNKLNSLGKNEANKRIAELTQINIYTSSNDSKTIDEFTVAKKKAEESKNKEQYYKDNSHLITKASHDKEGNFTEEDYKHDDDLMLDDDLWK